MLIVLYGFAFYAYMLIFISHNYNNKYFVVFIKVVRLYFNFLISIILGSLYYLIANHYHYHFHHYLKVVIIHKELKNLLIKCIANGLYLETLINYFIGCFDDGMIFFIVCFVIF